MKEIWKNLDFDERYAISNTGKVMNKANGRIRKPSISKNGYFLCVFSNPGKKHTAHYIHRLVAHHFFGPCPKGKEVSHLDGNKSNNCTENLIYETHKINVRRRVGHGTNNDGERNGAAKLNTDQVMEIIKMRRSGFLLREIAEIYGVSFQQVSRICNHGNWGSIINSGEKHSKAVESTNG